MSHKLQSEAYERGFASGRRARGTIRGQMESAFRGWRGGYPASAHLDYAQELVKLERERLDAAPSTARFPETKGWGDVLRAERRAFAEGCGCGPDEVAFRFNYHYFMWARLNTRYVGPPIDSGVARASGVRADDAPIGRTANCTAVFIRDSSEGGPLYGRNWDVTNSPEFDLQPPRRGPDDVRRLWCKGVSCATLCDEEPTEIFPIDAWRVLPDDCRRLSDVVGFLDRYVEFWMPNNGVIVDENLDSVAYEKANCRVGWRHTDNGTAAVTACAQVIPEIKAHRDRCHRRSLELRGYDETSPDWKYWTGAEARYRRLLSLVRDAASMPGGPTLKDMAAVVTDHAVPYPDRICLAGETGHADLKPETAEWTMRSRAAVLHGPNRRTLFWRVEGDRACYENPPFLVLGEGVEMKPQWRAGTRPPPPADGPDDEMEKYRQYEFDYPNEYPQ